jgi:hypothetical protein
LCLKDLLKLTEQIFISLDFCSTFYQEKVESDGMAKAGKERAQKPINKSSWAIFLKSCLPS